MTFEVTDRRGQVHMDMQGTGALPSGLLVTSILRLRIQGGLESPPTSLTNFDISSLASLQ